MLRSCRRQKFPDVVCVGHEMVAEEVDRKQTGRYATCKGLGMIKKEMNAHAMQSGLEEAVET